MQRRKRFERREQGVRMMVLLSLGVRVRRIRGRGVVRKVLGRRGEKVGGFVRVKFVVRSPLIGIGFLLSLLSLLSQLQVLVSGFVVVILGFLWGI